MPSSGYGLEPMMFTLAVLRHCLREDKDCWKHLGLIPKFDAGNKDAEESTRRLHECLAALLAQLEGLQKDPSLLTITLFGRQVHLRLILEVAFVIGDQKSPDS